MQLVMILTGGPRALEVRPMDKITQETIVQKYRDAGTFHTHQCPDCGEPYNCNCPPEAWTADGYGAEMDLCPTCEELAQQHYEDSVIAEMDTEYEYGS